MNERAGSFFDLSGQIAVVTGGGRGIGAAIAHALAQYGARLVISGRNRETLGERAEAMVREGFECTAIPADVSSDEELAALRDQILERFGRIDILVNNAGVNSHYGSFERSTPADWEAILEVNLKGVFRGCWAMGSVMLDQGRGCIINVSSVGGRTGLRRQVPYSASKGGVEQLTRSLAVDWAERGVRVNAIAYAYMETALTAAVREHEIIGPRLLARTPMGRFGTLAEVGAAAVFLASPGASYVTGISLPVDGGWTAG